MAAAAAAASGTRPLLFRPLCWDRRFRLASAPGSALSHLCSPPEGRAYGPGPPAAGPGSRWRGRRPGVASLALLCPHPQRHPLPSALAGQDVRLLSE